MKKLICLFGLSALLLTSCSSSDSSSSTTDESDVLVTRTVETYANDGSVVTTNYTYNGKKAVQSTDSDGYYDKFIYTGDLLTRVEYYNFDDELEQTETFTYNSSGQVITYVRSEPIDDLGVRETYVYNSNGTVSTTSYIGNATSQTTAAETGIIHISGGEVTMTELSSGEMHMYTYDTKNNPFKNVTGFDKILFVEGESTGGFNHNIVTDTYTGFGTEVVNSVYTYNAMNYPLTAAETEGTDATTTITTQYTYN